MNYPLCLRSAKSPQISPTGLFPKSMTISTARMSITNKLLFTPTTSPAISSKLRNIINKPHFYASNYHTSSRAQINIVADDDSRPVRARSAAPVASLALACALGVFCFGAAAMAIGAGKASAPATRPWFSMGGGGGGVGTAGGPAADHRNEDEQRTFSPLIQKDVVLSLSKTRRYLSSLESRSRTTPADLDSQKRNALEEIKKGKDVEMALKEMKNKQRIDKKSCDREGNYQIKMEAVEILIAQGKFDKALELLESLERDLIPSDLRPSLYKAIIYTMRYDKNHPPDEHWDKFFEQSEFPDLTPLN